MDSAGFPQVMVAMAQERSLSAVLRAIVAGIAQCERVVLARIWLSEAGDICDSCPLAADCHDRRRCLHLAASAGNSIQPGTDLTGLTGAFRRFPFGVRKIGLVGQTGEPLLLTGLRGDEVLFADPAWLLREGVNSFAAQPLAFRGEIVGVLAMFDRGVLDARELEWLRVFADHAAVSLANARAFEEIESLRARLENENAYLRQEVVAALGTGDIIGASPGLQKILQQIRLVAPTDAAVLITGESGTGKELVAQAVHDQSERRERSMIRVNCSAVPDTLFESEFFGHARGAFTGALRDRPGRFELADGGTLFLDEIGEVPLPLQGKLLRVLQEQELERVGDNRTRKVDVRIVAATNRDLRREVEAGRFRQDLFYRLSVFPIEVPPLRDRREDIPPLALHFAGQSARRMNRPVPRLGPGLLMQLAAYDWPGNIRELQNAVERAVILSEGGTLRFDLPGRADGPLEPAVPTPVAATPPLLPDTLLTRAGWRQAERESMVAALDRCGGRVFGIGGAAALLGMKPTTLASRLKALGITPRRGPVG